MQSLNRVCTLAEYSIDWHHPSILDLQNHKALWKFSLPVWISHEMAGSHRVVFKSLWLRDLHFFMLIWWRGGGLLNHLIVVARSYWAESPPPLLTEAHNKYTVLLRENALDLDINNSKSQRQNVWHVIKILILYRNEGEEIWQTLTGHFWFCNRSVRLRTIADSIGVHP